MSTRGDEPYDTPLVVDALEGQVVLLGPRGIAGAFTPKAAEESARRLMAAAARAREPAEGP